ncbi:MAG: sigma-70 family RNA polymerase sigma factor [Oscillospiraceae bacterium]|nr:sigma-70 family RNA polymerase sigma factor [Oscillospiraceae bacterium]
MNDEKIIKSIINRDEAAVNEVIIKYSKLLWKVAGTVLNNIGTHQDVEECVADTFIYLWENPAKFDPQRGKLRTWLCVIARTQAVNRCREIAKRNTVSLEEAAWATYVGVIDGVLKEEARKTLFAAINALGELEREILIRRYYYEQKPKEIAVALDMSVKQIDNHLYQTKKKLRSAIAV